MGGGRKRSLLKIYFACSTTPPPVSKAAMEHPCIAIATLRLLACKHCCRWCTSTQEYSMSKVVFGANFRCAQHSWHFVSALSAFCVACDYCKFPTSTHDA